MKIGLIGRGFVGDAIYENLKKEYDFLIYDIDSKKSTVDNVRELTQNTSVIFVALPTPMDEFGVCDLSIVFNCFDQISCWYNDNIIILKSTVPPGTCEKLKKTYPDIKVVFSPEFLTESNSIDDFYRSNRVILGGEHEDVVVCLETFKKVFPNKNYLCTNHSTAEMVKYFINNFLSVKVSFANEMFEICDKSNINYDEVVNLALYDNRIGKSHLLVPGPDGLKGFGGTCFPKDINAMINYAKSIQSSTTILEAAWEKNLEVREEKDWLKMEGRAISKKIKKDLTTHIIGDII